MTDPDPLDVAAARRDLAALDRRFAGPAPYSSARALARAALDECDRLRAENDALMGLLVRPGLGTTGCHEAMLASPWDAGYTFRTRAEAVAAVRKAAGLDPGAPR